MRFQQPAVRLDNVRLGSLGLSGGTLVAGLVVTNPNDYELRSGQLNFTLDLREPASTGDGWVRIAEGNIDRGLSILARDSAAIEVPIDFVWSGVGSGIRSVLESGLLDYRLNGDLAITRPLSRTVPFRRTGQIDVVGER
jgi:LEA14-like dessication related protein